MKKFTTVARIETTEQEVMDRGFHDLIYDIDQARQSNFRAMSLLTDYGSIIDKILSIDDPALTKLMLQLLSQVNYTGRCLGGVLDPNKSLNTDQRQTGEEVFKLLNIHKKVVPFKTKH